MAPVLADEFSGPSHITLITEDWGTLYYVPGDLHDYEFGRSGDGAVRSLTSHLGKVTMNDATLGQIELTSGHGKTVIESGPGSAKVTYLGAKYEFVHENNTFRIKTPTDDILYTFAPHLITVTGKKGKLTIADSQGDYRVESPMGVYTYKPTPNGGFVVKGGPLAKHPYLFRGATFEDSGAGVFIDFKKLDPSSPLFKLIDWSPMMEITHPAK